MPSTNAAYLYYQFTPTGELQDGHPFKLTHNPTFYEPYRWTGTETGGGWCSTREMNPNTSPSVPGAWDMVNCLYLLAYGGSSGDPSGWWSVWNSPGYFGFMIDLGVGGPHEDSKEGDEFAQTKDPINVLNGAVSHSEDDLLVPCPGIQLKFSRYYNSQDVHEGTLGLHWSHTYDITISESNDVVEYDTTNDYRILRLGDGERLWFMEYETNLFSSPFGEIWTLDYCTNDDSFAATSPEGILYAFDSHGVLQTITHDFGNTLTFSYTNSYPSNLLTSVSHGNGLSLEFTYLSNRLATVSTPSTNLSLDLSYSSSDDLTNATLNSDGASYTHTYRYEADTNLWNHSLTQIVDAVGDSFAYEYMTNESGHITSVGIGMTLNDTYFTHEVDYLETNDFETQVTYDRGDTNQTFIYHYLDIIDQVDRIEGPNGTNYVTYLERDAVGNLVGMTVTNAPSGDSLRVVIGRGSSYTVTNMAVGLNAKPTNSWVFAWNTNYSVLTSVTDPEGGKTECELTNSLVSRRKVYYGASDSYDTAYAYTTNGLLASFTNANGHWMSYSYDAYGRLTSAVPQVGPQILYEHSTLGHLEKILLPSSEYDTNDPPEMIRREIDFEPDSLGRFTKITYPDNRTENFGYDPSGNLTNYIDRGGRTTAFTYEPAGRVSSITRVLTGSSNQNAVIEYNYDNQFNTLDITDELGREVEAYELDIHDRPIKVTNVESQEMTLVYMVGDFVDSITRFDGTEVDFSYNGAGLLSKAEYPDETNSFSYLKNGLLRTAGNSSGIVSNTYNQANRITQTRGASPSSTVDYIYYPAGQISNMSYTAGTADFEIDAADRVTEIDSPEGTFSFIYDNTNGMVQRVDFINGVYADYIYDDMDRLTRITWRGVSNEVLKQFAYSYSDADLISQVTFEDGSRRGYGYDSLDRLTDETHFDSYEYVTLDDTYQYDLAGNRTQKLNGDIEIDYTLGAGNRLSSWNVADTNLIGIVDVAGHADELIGTNDRYGELWVSNTVSITPAVAGTNFTAYAVPLALGSTQEVVAAIRDLAGNMAYATNSVFMTVVTNGAYGYNDAGCVTSIVYKGEGYTNEMAISWDSQYRLKEVAIDGTTVEQHEYDALGRRVKTAANGVTNYLIYNGIHVIAKVDASGSLKKSYTWGPGIDELLSMTVYGETETNTYYYLTDHLGSVHAVTDEDGQIVESYRYDAWGRVLGVYDGTGKPINESAIDNHYLWQGRWYSWDTDLYYFRARWYESVSDRWLSRDPIGISGGLNQYVFCGDDPLNWIDPLGLCAEEGTSGVDCFQGGLDVVGVFDPFGVADGLNALIYLGRGQKGNAAISAVGLIPYLGDLGKAGKYGAKAVNVTSKARSAERALEIGEKFVGKGYKEVAPGVYRSVDGSRQFRMTGRDLTPTHGDIGPHVHYQKFGPVTGAEIKNIHTPITDP
ncbi:MAG: RHS domain-containing protein [Verrucomicrobia bacterium]|nr:RHS domain-containing protein [Verrucomicrobiota bacterium]